MRKEFEMTEQQFETLMNASKPVPYMIFGGREPRSPQERANTAWQSLGNEMNFDHMTVQLVDGKEPRFFTAETDFMDCNNCGESFDMRDLDQVIAHESCEKSIFDEMNSIKSLSDSILNS